MKYSCIFLVMMTTVCLDTTFAQNNVIWGGRQNGDFLIYRQDVKRPARPGEIVTAEIRYPPEEENRQYTITAVQMTDHHTDGNGGYPVLVTGGPGLTNVAIKFLSARGEDIDYNLEIFGRE